MTERDAVKAAGNTKAAVTKVTGLGVAVSAVRDAGFGVCVWTFVGFWMGRIWVRLSEYLMMWKGVCELEENPFLIFISSE